MDYRLWIFLLVVIGEILLIDFHFRPSAEMKISFAQNDAKRKRVKINPSEALGWGEKLWLKTDSLLKKIGKDWRFFLKLAAGCFFLGLAVGFILLRDLTLTFIVGAAFIPLSYLFLFILSMDVRKKEIDELENTMSIITNAYIANDDILRAFQTYIDEKNRYVDERFRKVTPFDEFVSEILFVNPNVERGLVILGGKIDNSYFKSWIKNLILCTKDRRLKFSLIPVINAMNDEKALQIENETAMLAGWRSYLMTVAVMFSIIPVLKMINEEWFLILTQTAVGKIFVVAMVVTALLTACLVMRINKPVSS